ncbi:MAG: sugar ABC transporter permease [Clostridiales bacterium]|nr:sugar ABC transporter permease [Clostridiales bacterium]
MENIGQEIVPIDGVNNGGSSTKKIKTSNPWYKNWTLYLLLVPSVVYIFIFSYLPMLGSVIAFKDYNSYLGLWDSPWAGMAGFQHFVTFVKLPNFWNIIFNTLYISVYSIVLNTILPVILALFVNEIRWKTAKKTVQIISYCPYFISTVVVVGMLFSFSNLESGLFNQIVTLFGGKASNLMESEKIFPHMYVFSGLWQGLGWWSIVYFGALANVDQELHEAAVLDGAGRIQRIIHINVPTILPMVIIMFIMSIGNMLNVGFEKVYLMQTSGNLGASEIISTYVYRVSMGALVPQFSYATAISLFNSVINIILLVIANVISKKVSETSLW